MLALCPNCQSSRVSLIEHQGSDSLSPFNPQALNHMTNLALLGISVARKYGTLPPAIGGLAGAVLGGLFSVVQQSQSYHSPMLHFYCQDCQHQFTRPCV